MAWRPYALLGVSVLAAVRTRLDGAVRAWCADWGVADHELAVTAERAWECGQQPVPVWRLAIRGANSQLWLGWPSELAAQLQRLMFPPDQRHGPNDGKSGVMAEAAAAAALEGLVAALSGALGATAGAGMGEPDSGGPGRQVWAYASGAMRIDVRVGKYACTALLDHGAVQALAAHGAPSPSLPQLKPVNPARMLGNVPVTVRVEAGRAIVSLGSLRALCIGDVIRLDTVTDQPLPVRSVDDALLFGGHLGLSEGRVALEVVSAKTISEVTAGVKA
jgi:flagellar motor switch/type III secretory pathway protein FliN